MLSQLEKAIRLAKKTNDRLIVFESPSSDDAVVILPFEEYEKLGSIKSDVVGLTEGELLDKINRDIAIWKNQQGLADFEAKNIPADDFFSDKDEPGEARTFEENRQTSSNPGQKKVKNNWAIPRDIKAGAEEIIEEDRQYLEEIPQE